MEKDILYSCKCEKPIKGVPSTYIFFSHVITYKFFGNYFWSLINQMNLLKS